MQSLEQLHYCKIHYESASLELLKYRGCLSRNWRVAEHQKTAAEITGRKPRPLETALGNGSLLRIHGARCSSHVTLRETEAEVNRLSKRQRPFLLKDAERYRLLYGPYE